MTSSDIKDKDWKEADFEVPVVFRPFQMVIVSTSLKTAIREVKLEEKQCNGESREEATAEPYEDSTDETTFPSTTDDWTTEPFDSTESPSTSSKLPSSSLPPTSTPVTSPSPVGSVAFTPKRRLIPFKIPRRRTHRPRPIARWRFRLVITTRRPVTSSPPSNPTNTPKVSITTPLKPTNTSVPTFIPPTNSTASPKVSLTTSSKPDDTSIATSIPPSTSAKPFSSKVSVFVTKVLSSTSKLLPFTKKDIPTPKVSLSTSKGFTSKAPSSNSKVSTFKLTSTTSKSSSPLPKVSSVTFPSITTSSFTPKITTFFTTSKFFISHGPASISPIPKIAYFSSTSSPKQISTSSTTLNFTSSTLKPTSTTSSISRTTFSTTSPPTTTTILPSTRTTLSSTTHLLPSIYTYRGYAPHWQIESTSSTTPKPYRVQPAFRLRSTTSSKPTSTISTYKKNESMDAWPGPRVKVRTKYTTPQLVEIESTKKPVEAEPTVVNLSTQHAKSGITNGEIAVILIGVAICVGGIVWCLRKRLSWLQSSRVKLGESYSLQVNYADDVGMDVLPSLANGRNGTANGRTVEESCADGDRGRSSRRKKCSTSATLGGLSRLKGTKNYSELSESNRRDYYDDNNLIL